MGWDQYTKVKEEEKTVEIEIQLKLRYFHESYDMTPYLDMDS